MYHGVSFFPRGFSEPSQCQNHYGGPMFTAEWHASGKCAKELN